MMTSEWIFGWWNMAFLAPFLLALIYLGVYAASGVTFGEFDIDGDLDADFGAGSAADAGADSDAPPDGDGEQTASHGHAAHASSLAALTWLGVGSVPLSIVLMVLLMTFGAIGFSMNFALRDAVVEPQFALIFSLPIASCASLMLTGGVSSAIARFLPLNETSARRRHALLGSVGEAVFAIDEVTGVVAVREAGGDLSQVACRVARGVAPIAKGERVKLAAYDATHKLFFAIAVNPAEALEGAAATTA